MLPNDPALHTDAADVKNAPLPLLRSTAQEWLTPLIEREHGTGGTQTERAKRSVSSPPTAILQDIYRAFLSSVAFCNSTATRFVSQLATNHSGEMTAG